MSSVVHGSNTSVEVTHIDASGLWVLLRDREYFLPYADFPWFRDARVSQLLHVELESPEHLRWPDLDVDLALDALEHPESYPLIFH